MGRAFDDRFDGRNLSVSAVAIIAACAPKVLFEDVIADPVSQFFPKFLIEPEMDPTVDARVADVLDDLVELRVVECNSRDRGV